MLRHGMIRFRKPCELKTITMELVLFKNATLYAAHGIEAVAAVLIGMSAGRATIRSLPLLIRKFNGGATGTDPREAIRLEMGRWLVLALEFELAADILRTAVAPSWNEIGQLGAIVVIRTALNYFLRTEVEKADKLEAWRSP